MSTDPRLQRTLNEALRKGDTDTVGMVLQQINANSVKAYRERLAAGFYCERCQQTYAGENECPRHGR
jgi:hypothetical protein